MSKLFNPRSKTHRATAAIGFFGAMLTFLPTVREFIPQEYYGLLFVGVGLAFHYLRNVTTKPIDER